MISLDPVERVAEVPVGRRPRTLAIAGGTVAVACQDEGVFFLDRDTFEVRGSVARDEPFGVAADPRGRGFVVTLRDGEIETFDPAGSSFGRFASIREARGIAIAGDVAVVTRWRGDLEGAYVATHDLSDLAAPALVGVTQLPRQEGLDSDTDNSGVLSFLNQVVPSPDGRRAVLPTLKANVVTGVFRTGEELTSQTTARAALGEVLLGDGSAPVTDSFRHSFDDLDFASARRVVAARRPPLRRDAGRAVGGGGGRLRLLQRRQHRRRRRGARGARPLAGRGDALRLGVPVTERARLRCLELRRRAAARRRGGDRRDRAARSRGARGRADLLPEPRSAHEPDELPLVRELPPRRRGRRARLGLHAARRGPPQHDLPARARRPSPAPLERQLRRGAGLRARHPRRPGRHRVPARRRLPRDGPRRSAGHAEGRPLGGARRARRLRREPRLVRRAMPRRAAPRRGDLPRSERRLRELPRRTRLHGQRLRRRRAGAPRRRHDRPRLGRAPRRSAHGPRHADAARAVADGALPPRRLGADAPRRAHDPEPDRRARGDERARRDRARSARRVPALPRRQPHPEVRCPNARRPDPPRVPRPRRLRRDAEQRARREHRRRRRRRRRRLDRRGRDRRRRRRRGRRQRRRRRRRGAPTRADRPARPRTASASAS